MIKTISISPGVTLRYYRDHRFKQGRITIQFLRPMRREEATLNALLPMVLLRGTEKHPDLRAITMHLDDLYGASVGDLVRRIGDYQTIGLYCSFTEDRFAMEGDEILMPTLDFLREILLQPLLQGGIFDEDIVESEKRNLIADLEAQKNDKAAYAGSQLLKTMCRGDSFSIPRLGEKEQAAAITAQSLYVHYQHLLRTSMVEIFYVGSAPEEQIAAKIAATFDGLDRKPLELPPQMPFHDAGESHERETMDIAQSRLCMGFTTNITNRHPDFAAMQVLNTLFGAGMTSKLFMNIREKMSLCYSIGSGYYGGKGLITVSAGIDADKEEVVRNEVLRQLESCQNGDISPEELQAAREAVLSSLRSVLDSPAAIEGYFSTAAISGFAMTLEEYRAAVENVTLDDAVRAAKTVAFHSDFFLEGVHA